MRSPFLPLAGVALFFGVTTTLAHAQIGVSNIIQADGSVKALHESQTVVTTRFGLFKDNWSKVAQWQTTGNGTTTFERVGDLLPGTISSRTSLTQGGASTNVAITATPSRTVSADDAFLDIMLDDSFWAGATFNDGTTSFTLNANFTQGFQKTGRSQRITVTRPDGFTLTMTTPTIVNWACQDARAGFLGFELRLDERYGSWAAGLPKTFQVNLQYTNGTVTVPDAPVVITPSDDWRPLQQFSTVDAGTVLDWKDPNRPAAGTKGWLKATPSGKLAFETQPGVPQRFYGANLSHWACYPEKHEAPILAEQLARMGYNTVRFHHFDQVLTEKYPYNSTTLDPTRLDMLNFFVSELKKRGIYVKLDLHSYRRPRTDEVISGNIGENEYKALLLVSDSARQNYLTYCSNLLNTFNPYTGMKWKDDPTFAWMSLGNENTPMWFTAVRTDIKSMLSSAVGFQWDPWSTAGSRAAVNLGAQTGAYLTNQLRTMGVKSLITDMNAGFERALVLGRRNLDVVDNHLYFGHPNHFHPPMTQKSTSPLRKPEEIAWFASSRILGKPFTVSEFDAVAPNQFRAEFGLMVGAISNVQQWDGLWRFQYSDNIERALSPVHPMTLFTMACDPLTMAVERAIVALYLRGDLQLSDSNPYQIANNHDTANQFEIREEPIVKQSIMAKAMGQVNSDVSNGSGIVYDGNSSTPDNSVIANLNDLTLAVQSGRTAATIGSEGQTIAAGPMSVRYIKSRATVYLTSLDSSDIYTSERLLLAHLTDVQNTGATFSGRERSTLLNWGTMPHLVKVGRAEIRIQMKDYSKIKVYRVNLKGQRLSSVHVGKIQGGIKFEVNSREPTTGEGIVYYELVR